MPRAMALFAKQGMNPIPAPADFYIKNSLPESSRIGEFLLPASSGGTRSESLFHEWLGIIWEKLRGTI
jgi:uncharacterized SAM-binding protein YcdF (DUF218 family)